MKLMKAIHEWIVRQTTTHEDPEVERKLIDAERRELLTLIARKEEAERKLRKRFPERFHGA